MINHARTTLLVCSSLLLAPLAQSTADAAAPSKVQQPIVRVTNLVVESVGLEEGELVANAVATLNILGRTIEQNVQIPLDVVGTHNASGECEILHLVVGPVELDLLGLVVALDDCAGGPVVVDVTAVQGQLLGDLLCGIVGLLDEGLDLGSILDSLSDADLEALTGGIADLLNQLFAELLGSGAAASSAQQVAGERCDIVTLAIPEGLELNVLGVVVITSGICLDVYAVEGQGNLLGNLLCDLTHLLDNSNRGGQQRLVQRILRLLDRLGL